MQRCVSGKTQGNQLRSIKAKLFDSRFSAYQQQEECLAEKPDVTYDLQPHVCKAKALSRPDAFFSSDGKLMRSLSKAAASRC